MKKISILLHHAFLVILLFCSLNSMAAIIVKDTVQNSLDSITEQPLPFAEEMAQYPGGTSAMVEFLSKNIRYPEEASKNGISGKVYVQFVIDKEGNILQPKVLKGIGGGCDEEALRLTKMFPKWIPAKQNGKIVSVLYTLPITFQIQEEALMFAEKMPEFPGGMKALLKFIKASIRYPEQDSVSGSEIVQFIVNTNGKISDIEIKRSLGPDYDKESVRLVKSFPDWIPGKQNGKLCAVYFTLPIVFDKGKKHVMSEDQGAIKFINEIITESHPCYFPGDSLSLFVSNHLQYPKDAEEKGIKGTVRVDFKIDKEGKVINPQVTRKLFPSLDQEALRIVKLMPDWIPAHQYGKPVLSYYSLDFTFGVDQKSVISNDSSIVSKNDTISKNSVHEEPLIFVEQMPEFPGGMEALNRYVASNIRYPTEAAMNEISGKVIAQFIVSKTGTIEHIKIIRSIGGGCDEEAIRLIKNMPRWKPGFKDGKPVPVYFTLPVIFNIK